MKFQLFSGCNIPVRLPGYQTSTLAVLEELGVHVASDADFNCCGYPMRNHDKDLFLLSSARNLAVAENKGEDILAMCKCCFGNLKAAQSILNQDPHQREKINTILAREGLVYQGNTSITHILPLLRHGIGLEALQKKITRPLNELRIGAQYGCHLLRPSRITGFEETGPPAFFDELINVTGAKSIDYTGKSDCCSAPLNGINSSISENMTEKKLSAVKAAGGSLTATGCPYCHLQLAKVAENNPELPPPAVYPQILGTAMGLPPTPLGIDETSELYNISGA